jgi:hypothetical protein
MPGTETLFLSSYYEQTIAEPCTQHTFHPTLPSFCNPARGRAYPVFNQLRWPTEGAGLASSARRAGGGCAAAEPGGWVCSSASAVLSVQSCSPAQVECSAPQTLPSVLLSLPLSSSVLTLLFGIRAGAARRLDRMLRCPRTPTRSPSSPASISQSVLVVRSILNCPTR